MPLAPLPWVLHPCPRYLLWAPLARPGLSVFFLVTGRTRWVPAESVRRGWCDP